MDGIEHNFPLPEPEAHKLDEVKEVLDHTQPPPSGLPAWVQSNPWMAVVLAGVGGLCLGLWLKARG